MKQPGKLPSLPALRVFEAAARLGSISAAATELHVTHSAVSQQVKSLEDSLGVRLFGRSGRNVVLTSAGRELALGTNEALYALAQTTHLVRQRANPNRLTVTTSPSFAACWLTPRIGRFIDSEPGIVINLISTGEVLDFARDGVDVAIRWSVGPDETLDSTLFMHDEMLVVASPGYLKTHTVNAGHPGSYRPGWTGPSRTPDCFSTIRRLPFAGQKKTVASFSRAEPWPTKLCAMVRWCCSSTSPFRLRKPTGSSRQKTSNRRHYCDAFVSGCSVRSNLVSS